jgi:hypothetical protein
MRRLCSATRHQVVVPVLTPLVFIWVAGFRPHAPAAVELRHVGPALPGAQHGERLLARPDVPFSPELLALWAEPALAPAALAGVRLLDEERSVSLLAVPSLCPPRMQEPASSLSRAASRGESG